MLEKCVLTILELNWNQRLGHKKTKLNICHHTLTLSTQLQNRSFHVVERTRTSSKCQKMKNARAKRAKILFFIVKYANLWGFCCRRRRGCLSSLLRVLVPLAIKSGQFYKNGLPSRILIINDHGDSSVLSFSALQRGIRRRQLHIFQTDFFPDRRLQFNVSYNSNASSDILEFCDFIDAAFIRVSLQMYKYFHSSLKAFLSGYYGPLCSVLT